MIYRFEPVLSQDNKGWRVDLCTGNRKKGTFKAVPVTGAVYTLAQAQCFVNNNRTCDYVHLLDVGVECYDVPL